MEMVRVLGIGVVGTVLAVTLGRHNGGYGLYHPRRDALGSHRTQ